MAQNWNPIPTVAPSARRFSAPVSDRSNPQSLVSLLPKEQADRVEAIDPTYFRMTEEEFLEKYKPEPALTRVKLKLFTAWEEAAARGKQIVLSDVYHGTCSRDFFMEIFENPQKLAWVVLPPATSKFQMEEMFFLGLRRMRETLEMPLWKETVKIAKPKGRPKTGTAIEKPREPNVALMREIRETMYFLRDTVLGPVEQRHSIQAHLLAMTLQAQQLDPNVPTVSMPGSPNMTPLQVLDSIDRQIQQTEHAMTTVDVPAKVTNK
jgi:hypothetical protein